MEKVEAEPKEPKTETKVKKLVNIPGKIIANPKTGNMNIAVDKNQVSGTHEKSNAFKHEKMAKRTFGKAS